LISLFFAWYTKLILKRLVFQDRYMKKKRQNLIIFTGGGTLGHVFPGIAVLNELNRDNRFRIVWIGSRNGMEKRALKEKGIPFYGIPCGKLRRYFSLSNVLDIFKVLAGFFYAFIYLLNNRPSLVFSKGGYVSVPSVVAAYLLNIPVFTHECDYNPGLATRINSRFAEKIFISFKETEKFFPPKTRRKVVLTGNPVRKEFLSGSRAAGRKLLGIPENGKMVLVLGGSQGARSLNQAIDSIRPRLAGKCTIVHQRGRNMDGATAGPGYLPKDFFKDEFPDVLAAADLAVSRAGANMIWEIALAGKPSVLVPLPASNSRGDQILNADLFRRNGLSLVAPDDRDLGSRLLEQVTGLLDHEAELKEMEARAKNFLVPDAAERIAGILRDRAGGGER
jgi:UDP-N-acetylglucosamine--N-acetylmuramyl-(pentapeptide) pyrophosphoryl-undecaprenol N-acetylglucosamine transferase